jgi:hypothetical protein
MKCKPITAKAAAKKTSPLQYQAALVNDLKGMYKSKGFVDVAQGFGTGLQRASAIDEAYSKETKL